MGSRLANSFAIVLVLIIGSLLPAWSEPSSSIALAWNDAALKGARDSRLPAPEISRALAIVHTCIYDAWAAYDERAVGTQMASLLRRPVSERTERNKEKAVSYAAFRALNDVLPVDTRAVYRPLMRALGFDPDDSTTDVNTASGIGNVACEAVLEFRHRDGSNQLGNLHDGPYTDWTAYTPRNRPSPLPVSVAATDLSHWQPLTFLNGSGDRVTQNFAGAQWGKVVPFALERGDELRSLVASKGLAQAGTPAFEQQAAELVAISGSLTDREKVISEFWTDGVNTSQPSGHWLQIAQEVSRRDHHTLDDDVRFFFVLSNALLDAGISAWDAKAAFDSVRPITAITALYRGQTITAWGGPGQGAVQIDGKRWLPYQDPKSPTPPFPEFVSGHSAYSAAAATILRLWTGSDTYGGSATIVAGSSKIEPGITPHETVLLHWSTFSEAATEAGMSRRYGGIHFKAGDEAGRALGEAVATIVWKKGQSYFDGTAKPKLLTPLQYASLSQ